MIDPMTRILKLERLLSNCLSKYEILDNSSLQNDLIKIKTQLELIKKDIN